MAALQFGLALHDHARSEAECTVDPDHDLRPDTSALDLFSPLMAEAGITRLADITHLDRVGLPAVLAIRPNTRSLAVSIGKGRTLRQARTAALMESLECWYAERLDESPTLVRRFASRQELTGSLLNLAGMQTAPDAPAGDNPDAADARRWWCRGHDLTSGASRWVPEDLVSMDFRLTAVSRPWLARTSNGLASGVSREAAVRHALCEVIERDAEWRWRTNDASGRIDLATVSDPRVRSILATVSRAGLRAAAWDITGPVGIPVLGCVIMADSASAPWGEIGVFDGFCCHPDPAYALAGALLEAVQIRLTFIAGSRDDLSTEEMRHLSDPRLHTNVHAELAAEPQLPWQPPPAVPGESESLGRLVETAGFGPVTVVDISCAAPHRPAVVRVVVPGLYGPFGAGGPPPSPGPYAGWARD